MALKRLEVGIQCIQDVYRSLVRMNLSERRRPEEAFSHDRATVRIVHEEGRRPVPYRAEGHRGRGEGRELDTEHEQGAPSSPQAQPVEVVHPKDANEIAIWDVRVEPLI